MSGLENFIFQTHSGVRWLVVLMTIVAILWLGWGIIGKRAYDQMTHRIVAIWSGLVGLQWLLGIILFVILGGFDLRHRWEHAIIMTVALAVAHAYVPLKKRPSTLRMQGALVSVIVVLVLVYVGVALLPQGWTG